MERSEDFIRQLKEDDPRQLRQVIEMLIAKSRLLVENLEDTYEKLEKTEAEKTFWKDSYFNLKDSCQHYLNCNGLTPFNYIASLEEELKHQKVYKSCLEEKFKVMCPNQHSSRHKQSQNGSSSKRERQNEGSLKMASKSIPSTFIKQSPVRVHYQNKHRIGPKNGELFRFRDNHQGQ